MISSRKSGLLRTLRRADKSLSKSVEIVCISILVIIVLTVSVSVFTRFVIFYPLNFADALAKYLMIWLAFLGSGLAIREGEHIAVNLLESNLEGKAKRGLLAFINVSISIFLIVVIYYGYLNAWSARNSSDPFVFGVSMMVPYLAVPVGAFYSLIQVNLSIAIRFLSQREEPEMFTKGVGGSL